MKCLVFFLVCCVFVVCALATSSCWSNTDCPPFQQCSIIDNHKHCIYINPCLCSDGTLSLVSGEACPSTFFCQDTPCAGQIGSCQYEGNRYEFQ